MSKGIVRTPVRFFQKQAVPLVTNETNGGKRDLPACRQFLIPNS
jgi:hypothetical protein